MFDFKTHFILNEGGVAGHMSHVYENINLTSLQLKELFKDLIQGKKENITEKVDGQNIFFTWDEISQSARFARRTSDIKNHGMSLHDLKQRFINHESENVKTTFNDGGDIIQKTLLNLSEKLRKQIFGNRGDHWVNAEIMHTQNPNLIQYSGNYIVLHSMQQFNDQISGVSLSENFKLLTRYLDEQTKQQSKQAWSVVGPRLVKIENFNTINGPYGEFVNKIDQIFREAGLGNSNTISDYIEKIVISELTQKHMPFPAAQEISLAVVNKKKINIPSLKKQYGTAYASHITEYAAQTNIPKIRNRITLPIQEAITDISVEVLKTLTSYFVRDHNKEINRVRTELRNAILAVENSKDKFYEERKAILTAQLAKLKNVENFCSTIEGIVFEDPPGSGNLYKLTGSFAPVNQILGLITYGKGSIPPIK